ncbi:RHS repeat-associated core domain-containing protein [Chiayiivirga flava]|nr:RHS repeat-associated core domain-containing protein [Chiayiivirga flava]
MIFLMLLPSIAPANPELGCLPAEENAEIAWVFSGVAYPTLECAEEAMRAVPGNADMERKDEDILSEPNTTIRYHITPKPPSILAEWWMLAGNGYGYCQVGSPWDPYGFCGSESEAVDTYIALLENSNFCNVEITEPSNPYALHGLISPLEMVDNVFYFTVQHVRGGWIVELGSSSSPPACNPHPTLGASMSRRTQAKCPPFYTTTNNGQDWPHAFCINNRTATITTRIRQICAAGEGNPCSPTTGNKTITASDITTPALSFNRTYNSMANFSTPGMPTGWTHAYSDRLEGHFYGTYPTIYLIDGSGNLEQFKLVSANLYRSVNAPGDVLTVNGSVTLLRASGAAKGFDSGGRLIWTRSLGTDPSTENTLTYNAAGRLASISNPTGRSLSLAYSNVGKLASLTAPDGSVVEYTIDALNRLESVTYPGGASVNYIYASPTSNLITGIIDELNADYATYTYDDQSRATSSEHAGGAERVELVYLEEGKTRVTRSNGEVVDYLFDHSSTFFRLESVDGVEGSQSYVRDGQGRITAMTDRNGTVEEYEYSNTHRTAVVRAAGEQEESRAETDWHATFAVPTERRTYNAGNVLVAKSNWKQNTRGQVLTQTATDPSTLATRITTYTYCEPSDVALPNSTCPILGLIKSIDGPRTDIADLTTYAYYPATDESGCATTGPCHRKGDLWKVTNALGHVTETLRYDRAGRVRASKDPNGIVTEFTWHPRGWLTVRTVKGATAPADATTTYAYDAVGQVTRITQPDGDYLDYEYDAAHRLVAIEDALGNRIDYTLDAAGNRTAETTSDAAAVVKRQLTRVYDQLGRLDEQLDAQNRATAFEHDANGNQTAIVDALNVETRQEYDPLNRLKNTIQDYAGLDVETGYAYDALDRLVTVTDPKGLDTHYTYDGLGNLTQLDSPDTGITTYTYDAAGNRHTQTDARGITATHTYDALNRLTATTYPDSSLNVAYVYDSATSKGCGNRIGRLAASTDASGTTSYCYDQRGNVVSKKWIASGKTLTTEYAYTRGDRLQKITLPTGLALTYERNGLGQITSVKRTDPTPSQSIVAAATYLPFGPLQSLTFAGGATQTFEHDQNYWTDGVIGTALDLDFTLDATGNITAANDPAPASARLYSYDPLARLTDIETGSNTLIEAFTYDGTGNRLTRQTGGGTQTYGYPPDSHRLASIDAQLRSYDAMGSLTARGTDTFTYDDRQRLSAFGTTASYTYNARGERASKTVAGVTTQYVYDEAGHLIAELDPSTTPPTALRSYVWLDDRPVAVYAHTGAYAAQWLHIHTDHLGTPRAITRPAAANATIWRWDFNGSAFGDHAPHTDPDGDATHFTFNLRFPGQYFDAESGLHYNYFRDYSPPEGRYIESDPIGLVGGISTYSYVRGRPLLLTDPFGLADLRCGPGYRAVPNPNNPSSSSWLCLSDPESDPDERICVTGECASGILPNRKLTCQQSCNLWVGLICGPIATAANSDPIEAGMAYSGCRLAVLGGCEAHCSNQCEE